MKILLKPFILLALISFILTGCAKNDDFSIPNIDCDGINLSDTKSLQELYDLAKTTPVLYEQDDVISGYVISSDESGNFFKDLYLVNDENTLAFRVPVDKVGLFSKFRVGRKLMIKLKDLYIQKDNGVLVIGMLTTNTAGRSYVGRITDPMYKKHVFTYCGSEGSSKEETELIIPVSIKEATASDDYLGKLVKLTEVQFAGKEVGKTYYDENDKEATKGGATNRILTGKDSSNTLLFRTSSFAEYSTLKIPSESGSVIGILTKFGDNYQFISRSATDLQLTSDRFGDDEPGDGGGDPEEPGDITIGTYLAFPGSDFEDFAQFENALNPFGLTNAAKATGEGWENGNALKIADNKSRDKNGFVFTVEKIKNVPSNATKMSFLIKGTSEKSLSINLYKNNGTNYEAFNLESLTASKTIEKASPSSFDPNNGNNLYGGTINTNNNWIKVTLNLSGVDYNRSGNGSFFAIRMGNNANYNLLIDEIRFEDGTLEDEGGNEPNPEPQPGDPSLFFPGADFEVWNTFTSNLTTHGIKPYATQQLGIGREDSNALGIIGTPSGNDYVFTVANISNVPTGKTKISFWLKGTSGKSLSLNIYEGTSYKAFNLGDINGDKIINVAGNNQYNGVIDTNGQWVKITLELESTSYNTTGSGDLFALKVGKDQAYNLLIDDIKLE